MCNYNRNALKVIFLVVGIQIAYLDKVNLKHAVLGGQEAVKEMWPWQAALSRCNNNNQCDLFCGGSLVTATHVVTAAHCVTFENSKLPIPIDPLVIYLGKHYRDNDKDDASVQKLKVNFIHVHPTYNPINQDCDIAVLKLSETALLNSNVNIVPLPPQDNVNKLNNGSLGYVTGWGVTSNKTKIYSDTLQEVKLAVIPNSVCEQAYQEHGMYFDITNNMFCAGFENETKDSCDGDSGGPMVFQIKLDWILQGIVSWGSPFGCGLNRQYGVYVQVNRFTDWIKSLF